MPLPLLLAFSVISLPLAAAAPLGNDYLRDLTGPGVFARTAFTSAADQMDNDPPEWGQGSAGYTRRFASRLGRNALRQSIQYGADAALGTDSRYRRLGEGSPWKRSGYALLSVAVTRRQEGGWTLGAPRLAGTFGSSILAAETWYPARYSAKDGLRLGAQQLAITGGVNIIREFWPEMKRLFRR